MTAVPPFGNVLRYAIGPWMCGIVAAAVRLNAFAAIQRGAADANRLAAACAIAPRRAPALLDGLLGLGLATLDDHGYHLSADARHYLVPDRPDYLGDFVLMGAADLSAWNGLAEAVRSGRPLLTDFEPRDNPHWDSLVRAIAPLARMAARAMAAPLNIEERGACRILDIAGGAGGYSAVWLALNPQARAVQLDWANVNRVARDYVAGFGVADRFETRDGDLHQLDYGNREYDIVILSLVSHFFSAAQNLAILRKIRGALVAGGQLLLVDLMLDDDRGGRLWPLAFSANMLLSTTHGTSYRRTDYANWLTAAGVSEQRFERVDGMPYDVIIATDTHER